MKGMIDRVEDGVAVLLLEEGGRAYIPLARLPHGAKPGTVLSVSVEVEGEADPSEVAAMIEHLRHRGHL